MPARGYEFYLISYPDLTLFYTERSGDLGPRLNFIFSCSTRYLTSAR